MFFHNYKYSLKTLFKNKGLIFWTFLFPIILGTFFNLAFSNIENSEKLSIIDIVVVDDSVDDTFKSAIDGLSDKNDENRLFNVTYTNKDEAIKKLSNNEITGYLYFDNNKSNIVVNKSGINETIFRFVIDEVNSKIELTNSILQNKIISSKEVIDKNSLYKQVNDIINNSEAKLNDISNKNLGYTMIEYYTLIAMAALYGGAIAMYITNYKLANMNSVGKRTSISGMKKGPMLFSSLLASYTVQLIGMLILFIFTIFVMKVNYGNRFLHVVLIALLGSLSGLSMGVAIATLIKTNDNAKTGILISITMLCCFLSGMMGITMKYVIDKNIPIINKINPASMITDGLYSLYYYNSLNRFYFDVLSLTIFSLLMIFISYKELRRQKYDSI